VQDWEAHIARITTFWSSVALMSGRYHGNTMAPHLKWSLEPLHFARWLALIEQTVSRR
jgi:hemoglobin